MENNEQSNYAEALDSVRAARSELADRLITPWWYHPALGGIVAVFIVVYTMVDGILWRGLALAVYLVLLILLMQSYKRLTGIWMVNNQPGRARRWTTGLAVGLGLVAGAVVAVGVVGDVVWPAWVAAPIAWIVIILVGRKVDQIMRTSLRSAS